MDKEVDWIFKLKEKTPQLLEQLKGKFVPGFFHYSLSGDVYGEDCRWGLGNTVFATKIYYTLGVLNDLPPAQKKAMINFIQSFKSKSDLIFDPLVKRKTFFRDKLWVIKNGDFNNFFHRQTMMAETRQAISVLKLLGATPTKVFSRNVPSTKEAVDIYLRKLNWERPWGAGSHFSHLIFFLRNSELNNKDELVEFAIAWLERLQHPQDGSWYKGSPKLSHKINAAMKIITGLKVAGKVEFNYADRLIDLCLAAGNESDACNSFDIIYALYYADKVSPGNYKFKEIQNFALNRLQKFWQHYYANSGGFSFYYGQANANYYGARISRGLNEPDIHGTCLFLWGVTMAAQILDINGQLGFKEQIP